MALFIFCCIKKCFHGFISGVAVLSLLVWLLPCRYASEGGHLDSIQLLLEHGADINHVDNNRDSALLIAAYHNRQ